MGKPVLHLFSPVPSAQPIGNPNFQQVGACGRCSIGVLTALQRQRRLALLRHHGQGKGSTRPPVAFQHPLVGSRCLPAGTDGYLGERFDVIVAMNAVHHVGLGRYGEPIKAEADSELLGLLQTMLVADGCILLGIPLHHQDVVVWNAHRLYGPVRLPRLLRPWHLRAAFGVPDKLRTRELFTSACFDRDTFHGAFTKVGWSCGRIHMKT